MRYKNVTFHPSFSVLLALFHALTCRHLKDNSGNPTLYNFLRWQTLIKLVLLVWFGFAIYNGWGTNKRKKSQQQQFVFCHLLISSLFTSFIYSVHKIHPTSLHYTGTLNLQECADAPTSCEEQRKFKSSLTAPVSHFAGHQLRFRLRYSFIVLEKHRIIFQFVIPCIH
jgi:hypothetical protein